ncbi:MAG: glucans biosynthesis glucosyltransferase MdoH, partial [Betaproteobacteria bacterium]|nr:glucans biosynthesis glucosyltransferase MdoH [Betaproteobacteria bacterium]
YDLFALTRSAGRTPPMRRGSMIARPWTGFWQGLFKGLKSLSAPQREASVPSPSSWERAASRRRSVLLALITLIAGGAALLLAQSQPESGHPVLRTLQITLFVVLLSWVAAGFVTALMGFFARWRGDPHALDTRGARLQPLGGDARTALIMPICNEPVGPVFAGLRATCESLAAQPDAGLFDVFVLSDSADPAVRAEELAAWTILRDRLGDRCRLYYRVRERRTRRKAGNVADFCRRWGRNYRYMVVLDADSVMSGESLTRLVQLMEADPKAGIIQTAPRACGVETLHARAQQFAGRTVGPLFTAGMQYWQLGESHYWGHNAIIRVQPFMTHCALATLPGRGGLSGEILSHDFVEAALMRRAGYTVWLASDLEGSYEQQPSNLVEELQRDRRWCQGNFKNIRLVAEPGLRPVHRAMLATGVMAYLSAPLWLAFLLVSFSLHVLEADAGGDAVLAGQPAALSFLWGLTLVLLFLPRVLAVANIVLRGEAPAFGGTAALIKSALLETALSALQAPVRMVAHTLFVLGALTGLKLDWKSPPREAQAISLSDAARRFAPVTSAVALLLGATAVAAPEALTALLPVGLPLLFAAPLAALTSEARWGRMLRLQRWLFTPEELAVPAVLRRARSYTLRPLERPARASAPLPAWQPATRAA